MELVGVAGPAAVGQALQLELEVGQHARVDQLAQLLGAEQVAQQVAVEGQRRGPALGQRRVALVHVDGDPAEQQRLGERRRLAACRPAPPASRGLRRSAQHLAERGQVEHVVEALAGGLEQDREVRVLGGHRQQVGGPLALLPQRRAPVGPAAGQQQGPGRALAEPRREHRGVGQLGDDQLVDLVGVDQQLARAGSSSTASGRRSTMPSSLHISSTSMPHRSASRCLQRHGPRRVHLGAERREHADPPVADLVAEALDHDGAVVGHRRRWPRPARRGRRRRLSAASSSRPWSRGRRGVGASVPLGRQLADERADGPAQLERAARAVAVPERHLAGLARRRGDDHPFVGDVLDAPGGRAEQERLARPALVDHLLVELAHPGAVGQEHAVTARGRGWCRRW